MLGTRRIELEIYICVANTAGTEGFIAFVKLWFKCFETVIMSGLGPVQSVYLSLTK